MRNSIIALVVLILSAYFLAEQEITASVPASQLTHNIDSIITRKIEEALANAGNERDAVFNVSSYIETIADIRHLTEKDIQDYLKNKNLHKDLYYNVQFWNLDDEKIVVASAPGTDYEHHFVNGYLIGYKPFETGLLWVPHYVIATRLKYKLDSEQFAGLKEIWQTSKEAFLNIYGDCEDHALALADWLIESGVDARVVVGDYQKKGHAWVVIFEEDKTYLLEATDKLKRKSWRHYPLAKLTIDYCPKYMFNRDYFWVNTGSMFTTDYVGKSWAKTSQFFKQKKGG